MSQTTSPKKLPIGIQTFRKTPLVTKQSLVTSPDRQ
jgi:hypothetical protein